MKPSEDKNLEPDEIEAGRLRWLKWITILAPLLFLGLLEILRRTWLHTFFDTWQGKLVLGGLIVVAVLGFSQVIFSVVGAMQTRLARQNQELQALQEAGIAITSALDLETVLQRVVEEARDLGNARYGALALVGDDGQVESFLTSGLRPEERARIGSEPVGKGLLGVPIQNGTSIRLDEMQKDPRSIGFPENHPPMRSLLAVPVVGEDRITGSLYLTDSRSGRTFTLADQARLERFATQAALAIDNARLHRQVHAFAVAEERDRIAREMHDSLAQVLGYVNMKAQAIHEFLRSGQLEPAQEQLTQLARAAREAYTDVRENILGLRLAQERSGNSIDLLQLFAEQWQDQTGIVARFTATEDSKRVKLSPMAELQLLRIVQESLTNVRKHAQAEHANVTVSREDQQLVVTIQDDGVGFGPQVSSRSDGPQFGLKIMEERAESAGGTLQVESVVGQGTRISIRLPTLEHSNQEIQAAS